MKSVLTTAVASADAVASEAVDAIYKKFPNGSGRDIDAGILMNGELLERAKYTKH